MKEIEKHVKNLGFNPNPYRGVATIWRKENSDIEIRVYKDESDNLTRIFNINPELCSSSSRHEWGYVLFRGVINNKQELEQVLKMVGYERD